MSDTRKEVFIQNLKDTTTVLQQLRVCIDALKDTLTYCQDIEEAVNNLNIDDANSKLNELDRTVDSLSESLNGIIGRVVDLENHNLYEYDIALSFEDDDNHSYYIETTITDDNDYEIGYVYTYDDIINILHLGQACYESDIGDPCFIYGVGSTAIEFMWYNGTSLDIDATPDNLRCSITKKREIY